MQKKKKSSHGYYPALLTNDVATFWVKSQPITIKVKELPGVLREFLFDTRMEKLQSDSKALKNLCQTELNMKV